MKKYFLLLVLLLSSSLSGAATLSEQFISPPDSARPWVYWYFMDGNMTREGMTADLEAMKRAGIGGAIFLEVNVGIARGPVEFMSPAWRELVKHAVSEADRLGLQIAMGAGPGWCGTGGPWVKPEQSMQHLVASEMTVEGPLKFDGVLPQPPPREPFFGVKTLTPELKKVWQDYYRDVAVLAFPTPAGKLRISEIDQKALYQRAPYSSRPGVVPFITEPGNVPRAPVDQCIAVDGVIDLSSKLGNEGRLVWDVPPGRWTVMRFGRTTTGQITRPAPAPGLGLESDKFEKSALDAHFDSFLETLFRSIGPLGHAGSGLTMLHFDSWEMSAQNWSEHFPQEFIQRRGYDSLQYLPVMLGHVVQSTEISERFLWDLRQTAQELIVENHALYLAELARKHGLTLSLEPYDLDPCADLNLGRAADLPMGEFWSKGGFATEFSCIEAVSVGHTNGRRVIGAESFTAAPGEDWHQYPGSMKAQGDWAFCTGLNKFDFHRYQHQPWLDRWPGMTMGAYGVHWERTQTWWDMVPAYHTYLSRCSQMLRVGLPVADILYLTPEGAPQVFRAPPSATRGNPPDRLGYNFDGCAPQTLIDRAHVNEGRISFPDGMSYRVLVLPEFETMTPGLLKKIAELVRAGATVIGAPPLRSPSLSDYPQCDEQVRRLAESMWGAPAGSGNGRLILDPQMHQKTAPTDIYPDYATTAKLLADANIREDFQSDANIRYTHRHGEDAEIYFIANVLDQPISTKCRFRVTGRQPQWWNPVPGEQRALPQFKESGQITEIPVQLQGLESGFVIFPKEAGKVAGGQNNFSEFKTVITLGSPWEVSFDPKWGGPEKADFATLQDWTQRSEPGIKYYSGKAVYRTTFNVADPISASAKYALSLGDVKDLAAVKLNGQELGIVWCKPMQVAMPANLLRAGQNELEVTVANLWVNRLIGDCALPQEKRLTWTTHNPFKPNSPLQPSGLLGPVTVLQSN